MTLKAKDWVTLLSAAFALLSIALTLRGHAWAPALILACVALDWLDGRIARAMRQRDDFGREIDSLADIVAFGAAPAAIILLRHSDALTIAACIAYVACGAIRLALFNLQRETSVYYGLPIPAAAVIAIAAYYAASELAWLALLVAAVAMVARFKLKKVFA